MEEHLKKLYLVQQELLDLGLVIQAQEAGDIASNHQGSGLFDEEDKAGKKALKASIDGAMIIAKLDQYRLEALKEHQQNGSLDECKTNTRSVEALRKTYLKEFLTQAQWNVSDGLVLKKSADNMIW